MNAAQPPTLNLKNTRAWTNLANRGRVSLRSNNRQTGNNLGSRLGQVGDFIERGNELYRNVVAPAFSVTQMFQNVIQDIAFVYNFDWGVTDQQLNQQIEESIRQLAVMSAGNFGQLLGWAVCGGGAKQVLTKFDTAMAARLARMGGTRVNDRNRRLRDSTEELDEEMLEEMSAAYANLLIGAHRLSNQIAFKYMFSGARSFLINSGLAGRLFGQEFASKWGKESMPPLSMAKFVEEKIERIPDQTIRQMVENGLEEFLDSCQEALMITASGMDSWLAYQRSAGNSTLGTQKKLKITYVTQNADRSDSSQAESMVLTGHSEILKSLIPQTIAQHKAIESRNVGTVIATPVEESSQRRLPRAIECIVEFSSFKTPYGNQGRPVARASYKFGIKRSKLDWEMIKKAAGGSNGYMYGPIHVTYHLTDGGQYRIYGQSESEADSIAEAFLALGEMEYTHRSNGEERSGGRRSRTNKNIKERVRIYPQWVTVCWFKKNSSLTEGRQYLNRKDRGLIETRKIALWHEKKPQQWDEMIAAISASVGSN